MRFKSVFVLVLLCGLWPAKASADNRFIVRTTLDLETLQTVCNLPLLPCTVVRGLGDPGGQLFLITSPLDLDELLALPLGIVDAEADQLLNLFPIGSLNTMPPTTDLKNLLSDRTPLHYPDTRGTVWNSYANQPAAKIVGVAEAQSQFAVTGSGIVADIDTGVDPTHPALRRVLLRGYGFTRNQPGGSELTDISSSCLRTSCPPPPCPSCSAAQVNQSTAAVLDQSTAAVLDCNQQTPCQYVAFGHVTMVMGVIHLVAPQAQLLPLKAFSSDGTGDLSNILHAVYYGVQNGANVINMSFDMASNSLEFSKVMDYANQNGVICASSAGNDGMEEPVYPAAYQNDVMGVASTSNTDTRSSFSNHGDATVWVAAPGEAIISTYPFGTYAAGWGTSFSAPFVSGAAALF